MSREQSLTMCLLRLMCSLQDDEDKKDKAPKATLEDTDDDEDAKDEL